MHFSPSQTSQSKSQYPNRFIKPLTKLIWKINKRKKTFLSSEMRMSFSNENQIQEMKQGTNLSKDNKEMT